MKSLHAILAVSALFVVASCARAEDWKTTDGKVYQDVKVIRSDVDSVTILHHDGGGRILLEKLPADLQVRFHYDPAKAKLAAGARAKADAENRRRLQAEMNARAEEKAVPKLPAVPASNGEIPTTTDTSSAGVAATSGDPSIDAMVDASSSMAPDPKDSAHHSIDELSDSAQTTRRSLTDPNYYTTSHMVYVIRQQGLGPDASDPKHHSMSEISGR